VSTAFLIHLVHERGNRVTDGGLGGADAPFTKELIQVNLCIVKSALGTTPAQAAGLTDHAWTIEEVLAGKIG
jgi:hypothetical protein